MLVHGLVAYAQRPFETTLLLELGLGVINFAAILTMYYGISRLSYSGRYLIVGIFSVLSITAGAVLSEEVGVLSMGAGWAAVLVSAVSCGVFAARQVRFPHVFAISLLLLTAFAALQLFPLWSKVIVQAHEVADALGTDLKETMAIGGYSQAEIQNISQEFSVLLAAFFRLVPAFSLMAAMFQFAMGFWLFVRWLNRSGNRHAAFPNFIHWKMPFMLTAFLILGILLRLLGNKTMVLIADNLLLILAVFYAIAGIALIEFFMKRFRFGLLSRFLIYLLFLLTHIVGFALLMLLGFTDSFFDWRRKYPLPLDIKTG